MIRNIGKVDRALRIVGGLVIILVGVSQSSWFGAIGLFPLVTGLIRFCPIYSLFKISSKR